MGLISSELNISSIQLKEGSAPSNPASGYGRIYLGTDGKLHLVNDTPLDSIVGGGGLGTAQDAPTELTIASGVITVTQGFHKIDTEANAGSDDLTTINGGVTNGRYWFRNENASRAVVFKHGTGNIKVVGDTDFTLNDADRIIDAVYDGTNWLIIAAGFATFPNDLSPWESYPDSGLRVVMQEASGGDLWYLRGDELRAYNTRIIVADSAGDSDSLQSLKFNTTTAATITLNDGSAADGHSLKAQALQIQIGTPHKILLPTGVYWNDSGTDRAALITLTTDRLEAVCHDFSGTLRYIPDRDTGISYAAS